MINSKEYDNYASWNPADLHFNDLKYPGSLNPIFLNERAFNDENPFDGTFKGLYKLISNKEIQPIFLRNDLVGCAIMSGKSQNADALNELLFYEAYPDKFRLMAMLMLAFKLYDLNASIDDILTETELYVSFKLHSPERICKYTFSDNVVRVESGNKPTIQTPFNAGVTMIDGDLFINITYLVDSETFGINVDQVRLLTANMKDIYRYVTKHCIAKACNPVVTSMINEADETFIKLTGVTSGRPMARSEYAELGRKLERKGVLNLLLEQQ